MLCPSCYFVSHNGLNCGNESQIRSMLNNLSFYTHFLPPKFLTEKQTKIGTFMNTFFSLFSWRKVWRLHCSSRWRWHIIHNKSDVLIETVSPGAGIYTARMPPRFAVKSSHGNKNTLQKQSQKPLTGLIIRSIQGIFKVIFSVTWCSIIYWINWTYF